jgi:hypothetical protein
MCDLSRAEQGSLTTLLGDLQAAEARLSATYPDIFSRAWADHEAMLALADGPSRLVRRTRLRSPARCSVPAAPPPR